MSTIRTRAWTGSNGATRQYVQNIEELIGLDIDRYGSGNVRGAALDGESLSNAAARDIAGAKAWIDEDGTIVVSGVGRKSPLTALEIADRIAAHR